MTNPKAPKAGLGASIPQEEYGFDAASPLFLGIPEILIEPSDDSFS